MKFISDDCTNIVMDQPNTGRDETWPEFDSRSIPLDGLKRLSDVGADIVLELVPWHRIESQRGIYDWSLPDEMVERCNRAGMKALLMMTNSVPQWCPDDWYVWDRHGKPIKWHDERELRQTWGCLSPWNAEAMEYEREYIRLCCARYNGDDAMCISAFTQDGEALLPPGLDCIYDPAAQASWRAFAGDHIYPHPKTPLTQVWMRDALTRELLAQQTIYMDMHPSRELVLQLHPVYTGWPASGVGDVFCYVDEVLKLKPSKLHHIVFQAFTPAFQAQGMPSFVSKLTERGISVFTGSEWPDGLAANTPRAIQQGIRGFVTAPLHPYLKRSRIDEWVYDAFAQSREMFLRARYGEAQ